MTSTRWAMNERSALIWFSCFCCASEKRRVMPASGAALWIDVVLAVRHSLSAPIWLNPSTMALLPLPGAESDPPPEQAISRAAAAAASVI
jgi:hypothetical protein